jgi:PAS domain S-box-containing protein
MDHTMQVPTKRAASPVSRAWSWLIQPTSAVTEVGSRQQSQLIAALSLVLFLLNAIGIFFVYRVDGYFSVSVKMLLGLGTASALAYIISRTRAYLASAVLITVTLSMLGFVGAVYDTHTIEIILFFVPFAYLIAMGTMPWQLILFTTGLNLLVSLLLPTFASQWPVKATGSLMAQFVTTGGLAVTISIARDTVERVRLAEVRSTNKQLQDLNISLEQRVQERTRDVTMAAEVGRIIAHVIDVSALLTQAVNLIRERFNLYHTQVYLADPNGRSLVLKASTGAAGQEMLRRGHRLPVDLTSLNGTAAVERRFVIVADTQKSTFFRQNPLLPDTRSEMAIPLIAGTRILGVLDIQSTQAGSLTEESLPAFEILAGQLTTALLNAELFAQVEQSLRDVEAYSRRTARLGWEEYLDGLEHKENVAIQYGMESGQPQSEPDPALANLLESPIVVVGEQIGAFQFSSDQPWSAAAAELVNAVSSQVAQQIENLRLLSQAEKYRREAEEAVHRLLREEWGKSLEDTESGEFAFIYTDGQVQAVENSISEPPEQQAYAINVQGEPVGHFGVVSKETLSVEDADLLAIIGDQLGAHLENMRLYSNARRELQEREKAEQALKESYEQVRSSEELVRTIIDNMPAGVFMLEAPSGRSILANRRAEEMVGRGISPYAADEQKRELYPAFIYGTNDLYPPEKLPTAAGMSGESLSIDDFEIRRPDGTRMLLQVNGVPVADDSGMPGSVVVVLQDITQARLAQETIAKRAVELATVAEVATRVSTIQNPDEMLQMVVNLTRQAFHLYHAHVYLSNDNGDTLVLTRGAGEIGSKMVAEGRQIALSAEKSLVARAARTRAGVIVNDVRLDLEFLPHPLLPQTRSELAVPMIVGDRLFGVIDIQDEVVNRFTPEDVNIMTTLAAQVAVSLQNARSYARAQHQAEREALINTISERIQATNSVEGALQVAVREIGRALGAQHTAIRLGVETRRNGN